MDRANTRLPQPPMPPAATDLAVVALYRFADIPDYAERVAPLQAICDGHGVKGILLLASEGINGTIAGPADGIAAVLAHIESIPGCAHLDVKRSSAATPPFLRMRVRPKAEIVTLGAGDLNPGENAGTYVRPEDWNALILDPDVVVVDTRNAYEVAIGSFAGALNPETATFRDLPGWVDANLDPATHTKVAMFCTGGIRCEKATALLRQKGFAEVYHLDGGILKYLETVPSDDSAWQGECFVFDRRVAVGHGLAPGSHTLCPVCRRPIETAAIGAAEAGGYARQACSSCESDADADTLSGARERQRQIELARARGQDHLGVRQDTSAKPSNTQHTKKKASPCP